MKRSLTMAMLAASLTAAVLVSTTTSTANAHQSWTKPAISGEARVGKTLTASPGTYRFFTNTELQQQTTISYQWFADGLPLSDETFKTLVLRPTHFRQQIKVRVTHRKGLHAVTTDSAQTFGVLPGIRTGGWVYIEGKNQVGQDLEVTLGGWNPAVLHGQGDVTCEWFADGVLRKTVEWWCLTSFADAGGPYYRLTNADLGKKISVKVTVFEGLFGGGAYLPKSKRATKWGFVQPAGPLT